MRLVGILALAICVPAAAQEVSRHRDWALDCRAEAPGQTTCVLAQRLVTPESGAEIAQIILRHAQGRDALVLRVPTGVDLTRAPAFAVDGGAGTALIWTACDARHCLATAPLGSDQVQALREGVIATFGLSRYLYSQVTSLRA